MPGRAAVSRPVVSAVASRRVRLRKAEAQGGGFGKRREEEPGPRVRARLRYGDGQSAKLAPKNGVPVVETPEVLGESVREPDVTIFVPSEGR